jgi:4-amino-4-deoxy-L-arabinose transferase-like glycosyltransferase
MRRLLRRAFNFSAVVSAVLFVAVCVLWARSHWRFDRWTRNGPNSTQSMMSMSGRLIHTRATAPGLTATGTSTLTGPPAGFHSVVADPSSPQSIVLDYPSGFARVHIVNRWGTLTILMVPYWSLVLLCALLPAWWLVSPRSLTKAGHCPTCGYDLRATPDRCPECGAVPNHVPSI